MDREQFIEEAKESGLPNSAIQEMLEIHEQAAHYGNPIPYSLNYSTLSDNDFSYTYSKEHISATQP